jgi:hypothetical protein
VTDQFDSFIKMQRDLERLRDPLGIGRWQREMQMPASIAEQMAKIGSIANQFAAVREPFKMFETMERPFTSVEMLRARELASTLSHLSVDRSKIFDTSLYGLSERYKSITDLGRPMSQLLSSVSLFSEQLERVLPRAHTTWAADLQRSALPWLSAHEALWPRDALVLRMLDDKALGIGSWLTEPVEADDEPHFALAALSSERAKASTPIEVELEVCCALCGGSIYTASATPSWVGPKLDLKIRVVPICATCNDREADEPGYMREALRELIEGPSASARPQLEIFSGDATDPVPRGVLTLVRDEEPDHDE